MHTIRTTPGLIIGSQPWGEADRSISIFTRDLGLVLAIASGIRLEKSKLRYFAQEFAFARFSLVKGKGVWRLTSAARLEGLTKQERWDRAGKEIFCRIAQLLKRLLHGEEAEPALFDGIFSLAVFLDSNPALDEERYKTLESLIVARIMNHLGYFGAVEMWKEFVANDAFEIGLIDKLHGNRPQMNECINRALRESHL